MKLKLSPLPLVMPGPHRLRLLHVLTPFGFTVQPWLVSRLLALPGL